MDQSTPQFNTELMEQLAAAEQELLEGEAGLLLANVQRLAGIGMLTAGIAQELANLLSIVTTASISLRHELQLQNSPPDNTIQHYMNLIERNAYRSARIITVLQDYGALNSLHMAITDIDTILRDTMMLVERQFREESDIRIEVNAPGETQSVICDHNRIVQLLINLLLNARDSMQDAGGSIAVKVRSTHNGAVSQSQEFAGWDEGDADRVAITIAGDGPGVSLPAQEPISRPFPSVTAAGNGVGLGLSIAYEIVQQHQGDIWFSNSRGPEEGASVTVVLPLRPSA